MKKISLLVGALSLTSASTFAISNLLDFQIASMVEAEETIQTAEITGVQVRSSGANDGYDFIVLKNSLYSSINVDTLVSNTANYNTLSKVKIFTSPESEGIYLSSICNDTWWTQNLWSSGGLMLKINDYSTYNGSTIYRINIEEGCELPCGEAKYVTSKTVSFVNSQYGIDSAKNSAFSWNKETMITRQEISLDGVQMRGFTNGWYYYLVLCSSAYSELGRTDGNFSTSYTSFDKIRLFTSEDDETGTPLSELTIQHVERNFNNWTNGLFINFAEYDSSYGGYQVYKVEIEKGCELLADFSEDEASLFVVDDDYTFFNKSYGYSKDKLSALDWSKETPADVEYEDISINGVQARGWIDNSWYQFLVIRSESFKDFEKAETINYWKRYISEDKIKIYTKDKEGNLVATSLSSLNVKHIGANFFDTGCYINFEEYSSAYNGTTIYKVEILEGCLIPAGIRDGKLVVFKVDDNYTYFNNSYLDESKTYENFDFSTTEIPSNVENSGTTKVETITNQFGDKRYLIIRLSESFSSSMNVSFYESKKFSNILDNILIYSGNDLGNEPILLRDIWTGEINLRQYGSPNDIGFSIKDEAKWNGSNMYAVKINKGCEFPILNNGVFSKKTIAEDVTFINTYYGLSGDIPGSYDSQYQTPRKYENFAVEWTRASIITFKVVGLDGVAYPKQCLISSSKIDISQFEVEGYELEVKDNLGYTYYEEIIVPSKDVEIALTYKAKQPSSKEENNGCSGNLSSIGLACSFGLLSLGLIIFARRKERNN